MTVSINPRCTACGACLLTCPTRALLAAPRRPLVDDRRCTDCWLCIEICPADAIDASTVGSEGKTP
jgi:ferredoxin